MGPSGSGKTTLLLCVSLILEPTAGTVVFDGETIYQDGWTGFDVRRLRREKIGFIFQSANLIPFLTARENVLFPQHLVGVKGEAAENRAHELLEYMEVAERADYLPALLSGGEQQRVAIARALANRPKLILADEPTASLDTTRGKRVMDTVKKGRPGKPDRGDHRNPRRPDDRRVRSRLPSERRAFEWGSVIWCFPYLRLIIESSRSWR